MHINLIIMAAGNSKRFSENGRWENKLLKPIDKIPLVERCLKTVCEAADEMRQPRSRSQLEEHPQGCDYLANDGCLPVIADEVKPPAAINIYLVTRYTEVANLAKKYGVHLVISEESVDGASYTIRNGLQATALAGDHTMFIAADQPMLTSTSIIKLYRTLLESGKGIASMGEEEKPGNPVIFSKKYYKELMELTGDQGGRRVAKVHREDIAYCKPSDPMELMDCDTEDIFFSLEKQILLVKKTDS